jgi:hypothetical protein
MLQRRASLPVIMLSVALSQSCPKHQRRAYRSAGLSAWVRHRGKSLSVFAATILRRRGSAPPATSRLPVSCSLLFDRLEQGELLARDEAHPRALPPPHESRKSTSRFSNGPHVQGELLRLSKTGPLRFLHRYWRKQTGNQTPRLGRTAEGLDTVMPPPAADFTATHIRADIR